VQVRGGGAVASVPASDGSTYFVLTRLVSDDDDDNGSASAAVDAMQPTTAVQQSASHRYSQPLLLIGLFNTVSEDDR